MEIGDCCEVYGCALEGGVSADVQTDGEAEAAIIRD
jgi:hypothetical protein